MPHSAADLGLFDPREENRTDTLNRFVHWWATPVQFVLRLFGFAHAGVPLEQAGPGTYLPDGASALLNQSERANAGFDVMCARRRLASRRVGVTGAPMPRFAAPIVNTIDHCLNSWRYALSRDRFGS